MIWINSNKSLKEIIVEWDNMYPWDLWWRKKYNIPFGSEQHKQQCLVASAMEYIEFVELEKDKIQAKLDRHYKEQEELEKQFGLNTTSSNIMPKSEQKITDEEFNELNLEDF